MVDDDVVQLTDVDNALDESRVRLLVVLRARNEDVDVATVRLAPAVAAHYLDDQLRVDLMSCRYWSVAGDTVKLGAKTYQYP